MKNLLLLKRNPLLPKIRFNQYVPVKKFVVIWFFCALTVLGGTVVINTFNAGELSPHMDGRVDFAKYRSGCRTLENFTVLPYGGAVKRPGTQYIGTTYSNQVARLIPMSIGVDQSYVIEMGNMEGQGYLRFYADGVQLLNTNSEPIEVVVPYSSDDIFEVQYVQYADTMYFTHLDYAPVKLQRMSTDPVFTAEFVEWTFPPLLERNTTDTTIQINYSTITNYTTNVISFLTGWGTRPTLAGKENGKNRYYTKLGGDSVWYYWSGDQWKITRQHYGLQWSSPDNVDYPTDVTTWVRRDSTASSKHKTFSDIELNIQAITEGISGYNEFYSSTNLWTSNHVGSTWALDVPRTNQYVIFTDIGSGTNMSEKVLVKGDWSLITSGNWEGWLSLDISKDAGKSWGEYRRFHSAGSDNYDRTGTELENGVYYRLRSETTTGKLNANFYNKDAWQTCLFDITGVIDATNVMVHIHDSHPLASTNASGMWSEAAFSGEQGYPRACEFYESRLWLAGTEKEVNTLWASGINDYENFETGTYDDSSMRLVLNSDNIIEWMLGRDKLFVGTLGDEWVLSGEDINTPLVPTAAQARKQTSYGSKDGLDALLASDSIVHFQRQGRRFRNIEYSFAADKYKSSDLTVLAEHITEGGIVQYAQQQQPEPVIWCVRADGQLIGLTHSAEQNVFAWHRHVTDGEFESVAVIPTDGEDRVYVIVKREIDGKTVRYIEWFRPYDWGDDDDAWFVDSGLEFDGGDVIACSISVDSNGHVTITADNTFSDGDDVIVRGTDEKETIENFVFSITNSTATNFVLTMQGSTNFYLFRPDEIMGTNTGYAAQDTQYEYDQQGDEWDAVDGTGFIILYNSFSKWVWTGPLGIPHLYSTNSAPETFLPPKTGWSGGPYLIYGDFTGTVQRVENTFTNVSHLAGETLNIFADGGTKPEATVTTNGVLTTEEFHNKVLAGMPYTATLSPMYIDVFGEGGNSYGLQKQPYRMRFRIKDSGKFNYGTATNAMFPVSVREPALPVGQPVPFYTGDTKELSINSGYSTVPELFVTSEEPLPLEILSMTIFTDIKEIE